MKKLSLILAAGVSLAGTAQAADIRQADNTWYTDAQKVLAEKAAITPITTKAKNVILMIADGNGVSSNYATRLWVGQKNGGFGEEFVLEKEKFPYLALSKTYNTNAQTPDSAATATATQSGVKTKSGVIGIDDSIARGDCMKAADAAVDSIGEIVADMGKSVGFVSTARITHATPAAGYAHTADRNYEDNSKLPEGCTVPDIASQLIDQMKSGVVDLAMGGGRRHFLPKDVQGEEGKGGKRTDGKNLIEDAKAAGIQYAWDDKTAASLDLSGKPILALYESSHMKYEHDRTGEPSIAEMTEMAIKSLSTNENGYFLQVEGGRIDHANHDGNLHRTVTDGEAFDAAVAKAMEMTNPEDTLIIVTADHDHALAFQGYCGRGNPVTGLCHKIDNAGTKHTDELYLADDGKPVTPAMYLNGPGSVMVKQADGTYSGTRPEVTNEEAMDPDYIQQALVPSSSETHSGVDVAIYARGPWAHLIEGTVEQNYIFHVMMHAVTQ